MSDVFISYARSSEAQAKSAADALRRLGYSVWLDEDLPTHRLYAEVIEEQLAAARAVVVIWSAEAVKSHWVRSEADRARAGNKLVQLSVDGAPLPMPFDQIQCAVLAGWTGAADHPAWSKVAASVAALAGGRQAAGARAPPAASPRPEGERRHLTVLDARLVGGAKIAAGLDPEEWHEIASGFQRQAAAAAERLDGHVARVLGDGLVVYFGYPAAREDAAERAVRAGLAIVEAAVGASPSLSLSVGIHTGTVVIAQTGGDQVDAFGDAPRLAAAVRAAAPSEAVVMTDQVHDLVSGLFVVEDLGLQVIEAAGDPARLFRAVRPGLASGRGRGFAPREATPFVGRDDEIRLLAGRWERVREGEGQMALIMGEPGIGKSRLIDEFRETIKADPHLWIECAGAPLNANTPFHAVIQMLRQGLGWEGDESDAARLSRLDESLAAAGLRLEEAVPLIAGMLGLALPDRYPPLDMPPDQQRRRLLAALAAWVFSATRAQPLVIVIEDLHWLDPSTLELIQTLVEQGATAPLMLLLTARPMFRAPWGVRGHHALVTLGRLSQRQTRELVAGVAADLDPAVIDRVIARTDGVPLFAEELTRLMQSVRAGAGEHDIPATLLDSLAARLDRLGRAREVAQLASVIGRDFTYELLAAISPLPESELQADLGVLAEAELIYARGSPPEASYRFKHALARDAAYETLLKSRRRALHGDVARVIAERFAALAQAQPELLARHWTEAGERAPAIAAWKSAGDGAYARRAFTEAETAYRRALDLLAGLEPSSERDETELELYSALNRVLQLTLGYAAPETVEAAGRARALAEKSGNLSRLIREEARIWRGVITAGDYAGAAALADHILDLAGAQGHNPGRLLFAHNAQVQSRFYTGDLAGVEAHFAALSPLIEAEGARQAPGNNIISIGVAAITAWALGHASLAHERMDRAGAFAEASKDPYDLAMVLHFSGLLASCQRDMERARAAGTQFLEVAEANGFSYAVSLARNALGWALGHAGAVEEGLAMIHEARASLAGSGARVGGSYGLKLLAEIEALHGDNDLAMASFEEALTANPQERVFHPEILWRRGELRRNLGDDALAEADWREAMVLAVEMGAKTWELRAATSLARLMRDSGEARPGRDLLAPLVAWFADDPAADPRAAAELLAELG
ncbi:MAG TPA: AAA family ATPase [Caulobacteraceae bacterium]